MVISDHRPVFIVGSPRSGTTLLRLILDSHSNLSSGPETQFLIDFQKIVGSHWYRIKRFGFEKSYWYDQISFFFDGFQAEYAKGRQKKRWVEKSPNYIHHLDFISHLFPTCQIIHIIRDGRDVVASHRDRWGYRAAIKAAKQWPRDVQVAQKFGSKVSSDRYFEIKYEDLVRFPEEHLRSLFEYLQEPWEPIVLDYTAVQHDEPGWLASFTEQRRTEGNDSSIIYCSQVGAGAKSLDPLLRIILRRTSGQLLKHLGYVA